MSSAYLLVLPVLMTSKTANVTWNKHSDTTSDINTATDNIKTTTYDISTTAETSSLTAQTQIDNWTVTSVIKILDVSISGVFTNQSIDDVTSLVFGNVSNATVSNTSIAITSINATVVAQSTPVHDTRVSVAEILGGYGVISDYSEYDAHAAHSSDISNVVTSSFDVISIHVILLTAVLTSLFISALYGLTKLRNWKSTYRVNDNEEQYGYSETDRKTNSFDSDAQVPCQSDECHV